MFLDRENLWNKEIRFTSVLGWAKARSERIKRCKVLNRIQSGKLEEGVKFVVQYHRDDQEVVSEEEHELGTGDRPEWMTETVSLAVVSEILGSRC